MRWNTELTNQPKSSVYGSPTFWNGTAYIGTSGPNGDDSTARGTVVALNESSGAVRGVYHRAGPATGPVGLLRPTRLRK